MLEKGTGAVFSCRWATAPNRASVRTRRAERRQRRPQPYPLSGATDQDDAGMGGLPGADTARR